MAAIIGKLRVEPPLCHSEERSDEESLEGDDRATHGSFAEPVLSGWYVSNQ
jgi:hypothetical protein